MASASVDTGRGDTLRTLPILPSALSHGESPPHNDPMDTTPPGPPLSALPRGHNPNEDRMPIRGAQNGSSSNSAGSGAVPSSQPKVVQTAFIHKLYR